MQNLVAVISANNESKSNFDEDKNNFDEDDND